MKKLGIYALVGVLCVFMAPAVYGQLCDEGDGNAGCWGGCLPEVCDQPDSGCHAAITSGDFIDSLEEEGNMIFPEGKDFLNLLQKTDKINLFQTAVRDILDQRAIPYTEINNVQEAMDAIESAWTGAGEPAEGINVVIFGHGSPGQIKVGEDVLKLGHCSTTTDTSCVADNDCPNGETCEGEEIFVKFTGGMAGMIKALYLYGCEVGKNDAGQALISQLSTELKRPIHAWTGKVYAFDKSDAVPEELHSKFFVEGEKKDILTIPTVSEWGLLVMVLLVLAAGTLVIRRARAMRAEA